MSDVEFIILLLVLGLIIAAFLGLLPAVIAQLKGRSFVLWWFYGWMLFIVALIHALCLDNGNSRNRRSPNMHENNISAIGSADEIIKYKKLMDDGIITQAEFDKVKREILGI